MKLIFCGCRSCKRGRKNTFRQRQIQARKRNHRYQVRLALRSGKYDSIDSKVIIGITD